MSCCNGTFSSMRNTWGRGSDLRIGSWDPYPEFLPANERVENYVSGDPSDCGTAYKWGLQNVNQIPLDQRTLIMREGYTCCRPQSYVRMKQTWAPQKRFGL